jgi:ParB family chromosome partitioning protein
VGEHTDASPNPKKGSRPKHGLGRGLGALIPVEQLEEPSVSGVAEVPISSIVPNPYQPRQTLVPESLAELADSIREHGVLQPLIVSTTLPEDEPGRELAQERYQLVAGERRLEAARAAGLTTVPVIIKEVSSRQMLALALVENLQRADLNPLEEASAYRQLMDEFGLTQEEVAAQVGKSRTAVANAVRLLKLPPLVKEALAEGRISEGHARALLPLEKEKQEAALLLIVQRGLNVRQTEELARRLLVEVKQEPTQPQTSPETRALEEHFRAALGTKVNLYRSKKGGRLVIHFYSEEELENIYQNIVGSAPYRE